MFWTEDLSLLTDQYEDIKDQQEELKARNRLLQKTYQQEAKRRKAEEQNRLLNLIQSQTTGQLELMTHFMEELEVTESKAVYERLLAQMIVIGTYLKRRKNLLLTMNNDSQEGLIEEDLRQSLAESCSALKLCQIRALYYVNVRPLILHDAEILQCYDYFEWLTEQLFGKMQTLFFRVVVMEGHLMYLYILIPSMISRRCCQDDQGQRCRRKMRKSGWFDGEFRREQCGNTEFCDDHDGNLPGI